MCTLTLLPKPDGTLIITSNRDEAPDRETFPPEIHNENGVRLLFPKDGVAGGTWIGVSSRKRFVSLMNGGFTAHKRKETYRMSRGIIVKDLLIAEDLQKAIRDYDLHDIEPFTLIAVDWTKNFRVYELVWDGKDKHLSEKPLAPAIWSSSLLYSEEMKQKRREWFSNFLFDKLNPNASEILEFHHKAGEGKPEVDLIMDRHFVKTRSITQVIISDSAEMSYEDLQTQKKSNKLL
ncbi:NRDE family protein [Aureitalea sp. L0-47]|uniref:NRDE family protein n=1 Tax=Aureitalea sp. L0-47 TaxID=2816962 RepID=UPI0022372A12|nr:NRDE family protein [Aureitalea sp. L0-47]MCW5520125.1 NRDE family protein [Aureitalea sp. L0-47]